MSMKDCIEVERVHVNNATYLKQMELWIEQRALELIDNQLDQLKKI